MTEGRKSPRRRRPHPAAASRILAAGISASVSIGLTGAVAAAAREGDQAVAKAGVLQPPPTAPVQPRPIIVQVVPAPTASGPARSPLSAPPSTLVARQPGPTRTRVVRTTTPSAAVAARPARTTASPPTTRPAPVTTSNGSKA